MATKKTIEINENLCIGCGQCVNACAQGVIKMIDGKAKLVDENHCDGLGNCIGKCPVDAITFIEKEINTSSKEDKLPCGCPSTNAKTINHSNDVAASEDKLPCGCPSTNAKTISHSNDNAASEDKLPCGCPSTNAKAINQSNDSCNCNTTSDLTAKLKNWPVQLKLVPIDAPYLFESDLLLSADCVPFAFADFHNTFIKNRNVLVGCPKLDDSDFYVNKLSDMITVSKIKSITVVKMEVPCCTGLLAIAQKAIQKSGVNIPLNFYTVSLDGKIIF